METPDYWPGVSAMRTPYGQWSEYAPFRVIAHIKSDTRDADSTIVDFTDTDTCETCWLQHHDIVSSRYHGGLYGRDHVFKAMEEVRHP